MPGKKMAMYEGYGTGAEKYKTKKQKVKHEKTESKGQMAKESKREKLLAKKKGKK